MNYKRYRQAEPAEMPGRKWPGKVLKKAPQWCSVDLRDGNQALMEPMNVEEKLEFFSLLERLGFKQIEVGFPAASGIEFDFIRKLVDKKLIHDGIRAQVLSPCRSEMIERTFEAIEGIGDVIFHLYINTSPLQRRIVYEKSREEIKALASESVRRVREFAEGFEGRFTLEFSTENFEETEREYALEVLNTVIEEWQPTKKDKMIINLPITMERFTPNVFADSIEWISDRLIKRDCVVLSIHPHNDRGTGVAAAELALLAGAERVEGTLFGNGERTGNVDIITLACNMLSQGIDPGLDLSDMPEIRAEYERLIKLLVPERFPYAGDLVFTAFSGGHQDAIKKGLKAMEENPDGIWEVPYLPIDPVDIGRKYEPLVRINSQSGKGGVAFIMEFYHGFKLPKGMHTEFSRIIQDITEAEGEIDPDRIMWEFKKNYIDMKEPYHFVQINSTDIPAAVKGSFHTVAEVTYTDHGVEKVFTAKGNGPIDAAKLGIQHELGRQLRILDYSEHALNEGSNAQAAAYIHLMDSQTGRVTYGVGVSRSTIRASVRAIFSAINRLETM